MEPRAPARAHAAHTVPHVSTKGRWWRINHPLLLAHTTRNTVGGLNNLILLLLAMMKMAMVMMVMMIMMMMMMMMTMLMMLMTMVMVTMLMLLPMTTKWATTSGLRS